MEPENDFNKPLKGYSQKEPPKQSRLFLIGAAIVLLIALPVFQFYDGFGAISRLFERPQEIAQAPVKPVEIEPEEDIDEEPLDRVEQRMHHEQLGRWMSHLSDQEQHVLTLRFGLNGNERHTLAEIGRLLDVSRERVRQVELKALRKLRNLTRRVAPTF